MVEPSLELISHQMNELLNISRALQRDVDMLIRTTVRLDHSINAMREDLNTVWLSHGDLRRRLEELEATRGA
jgi:hypothetical protein